jgi:hypothetical protein
MAVSDSDHVKRSVLNGLRIAFRFTGDRYFHGGPANNFSAGCTAGIHKVAKLHHILYGVVVDCQRFFVCFFRNILPIEMEM